MARKTKDLEEEPKTAKKASIKKVDEKKDTKKKTVTKKAESKKTVAKKASTSKTAEKKVTTKKAASTKKAEEKKKPVVKKATAKKDEKEVKTTKKTPEKKSTVKKVSTAKKATEKKAEVKKATTKKATAKKSTEKKATTKKATAKESTEKKTAAKKITAKKSTEKKATTKKATAKKSAEKKTTAKSKKSTTKKVASTTRKLAPKEDVEIKDFQPEYYDLPYTYNKTVVKVLAQTPKILFVYWEISEEDRNNYIKTFGERFFEETKPILVVHNHTMDYSFEIDINDFANSWYIHINDSNCTYTVELGRRPLPTANQFNNYGEITHYIPYYVYVTSSNIMDAPNNRMLFDLHRQFIPFRNVKTGEITYKDIRLFKFISNLGIMTIAELYNLLYPDENFEYDNLLANPSSGGLSSSGTFSSRFK